MLGYETRQLDAVRTPVRPPPHQGRITHEATSLWQAEPRGNAGQSRNKAGCAGSQ